MPPQAAASRALFPSLTAQRLFFHIMMHKVFTKCSLQRITTLRKGFTIWKIDKVVKLFHETFHQHSQVHFMLSHVRSTFMSLLIDCFPYPIYFWLPWWWKYDLNWNWLIMIDFYCLYFSNRSKDLLFIALASGVGLNAAIKWHFNKRSLSNNSRLNSPPERVRTKGKSRN